MYAVHRHVNLQTCVRGLVLVIGLALFPTIVWGAEHHVATDGTPGGDGSAAAPWDLATALDHPAGLAAGDTLLLHGGTYVGSFTSGLDGDDGAPIVVRSAPGEWAVIDGVGSTERTLTLQGSWTIYRDFEVTNSETDRWGERPEFFVSGAHLKLIHLVLHDLGNMGFWSSAVDLEVYGCFIYHNGYDDSSRGHGHAIYSQNETGTKLFEDNILFGGYSFGVHVYTEGGTIQGYDFIGNVWFHAGVNSTVSGHKDDCLVGGLQPAGRILLRENMSWASSPTTRSTRLGYSVANDDAVLQDNYFVGDVNIAQPWTSLTMTGNTFYASLQGVDPADHPTNTYLSDAPTGARVFVRPSRHQEGRANVVIYNWDNADSVDVDLSAVLQPGNEFSLLDGQNVLGGAVLTGIYDGNPVTVDMTGGPRAQPVGTPASTYPEDETTPTFNVFVVTRTAVGTPPDPDAGVTDAGSTPDDATTPAPDGAMDPTDPNAGGCACRSSTEGPGAGLLLLLGLLGLVWARRRHNRGS